MSKLKEVLTKILEIICIALFVFITIIGTYQIVTRYVFNAPSTISEELLTYSFSWMALLAAALVFGKREHMKMEFFVNHFSTKLQIILGIISELLILIFAALVLVYGGMRITKLTVLQVTASLGIPMSYIYVVVPISGILIILFSIINMSELALKLRTNDSK